MKNLKEKLKKFSLVENMISAYQFLLSPDHGIFKDIYGNSRCKFYPSCSEYALGAIRQYGLVWGGVVGLKRIIKCNPWNNGGYDPVNK